MVGEAASPLNAELLGHRRDLRSICFASRYRARCKASSGAARMADAVTAGRRAELLCLPELAAPGTP